MNLECRFCGEVFQEPELPDGILPRPSELIQCPGCQGNSQRADFIELDGDDPGGSYLIRHDGKYSAKKDN